MPSAEPEAQTQRQELQRVLDSPEFARNGRLSRFLQFVVDRHLEGRDQDLKESVIGVEVFGRRPDYNPKQDAIVRSEARRLRALLSEYYLRDGKGGDLVIELPKGGYTAVFRQIEMPVERTAPGAEDAPPRLGRWVWLTITLASLALVLAVSGWWAQHKSAPIAIAVLPLINLDRNPDHDYFADGLTGEIIRNLSIIDGLAVRSQTSSFVFKGKQQNVRDAGKRLNVEYILEGSVLRSGTQLRINAQLVRVRDDFSLWSDRYDRELTDVFAIQDEISRGIVNSLRLKLGRGRRRYETSVEAYDLYLRGRVFEMLPSMTGMARSIGPFEQAIAKDPAFAPAYAGLADAYASLSGFDLSSDRADQISKMRAAAEKAFQLDPLLAEAHGALAMVYARDAQWEKSEKSFRRAVDLDPSASVLRIQFVRDLLLPLGRIEEAIAQMQVAEKSDPLSPEGQFLLARVLIAAGRFDEAATRCAKPCVEALLLQGRAAEAIPILEARFDGNLAAPDSGTLGSAYALAGRRADAERIAIIQWRPIPQARIFTALGDRDRAFEALDRAIPLGAVRLGRAIAFAEFAPLRGDPRWKALRKKVGLPE